VNEVATGTAGFVEVANTGTAPVDVSAWTLHYLSAFGGSSFTLATIPAGTILGPGEFILFGGSAYSGAHPADFTFTNNLALAAAAVGLLDPLGNRMDSVAWGDSSNAFVEGSPAVAPPAGSSLIRLPDGVDTNNNAVDFTVTSTQTPGEPNQ